MAGTKTGGKKAAATNLERHGKDFYREIGAMNLERHGKDFYREIGAKGGRNGHTGGFASNPELAKIAGAKGGRISKRKAGAKTRSDKGGHHNMNRKEH